MLYSFVQCIESMIVHFHVKMWGCCGGGCFYRVLQIDLPSDVRGFPSVGTMYCPMASRVTA